MCPEMFAHDGSVRLVVLEDLGRAPTLADKLLGNDARAAERALLTGACRYKSVESILKNSLDRQPLEPLPDLTPPPGHDNIRGAAYFEGGWR